VCRADLVWQLWLCLRISRGRYRGGGQHLRCDREFGQGPDSGLGQPHYYPGYQPPPQYYPEYNPRRYDDPPPDDPPDNDYQD